MGPYDNKDIYDDQQGLGKPSSSGPGFEPPETYPAAPEIHNPETAATNGNSGDDRVNSATQQEQSALDNNEEGDESGEGSAPSDTSAGSKNPTDSQMKYTGNGKNNQSFGERMKKSFGAKGTALRAKNKILLATLGVFIAGIIVAIVLIISSIPGIQLINASSYLMSGFGIAANQANETYAKIVSTDGTDSTKTRLSEDRRILTKVTRASMKKAGIDFTYDNRGRAVSAHLDPAKNSELRGSENAIKAATAKKFGVSASDVSIVRSGMGYEVVINMHNKTIRVQENIIRDYAARTGRGKVMTFLTAHHFRDSLRVPSLFKPFQRVKEAAANKIGRYIDTKVRENERIKDLKAKVDNVRASMAKVFEAHSAKITAGRVTGSLIMFMCAVREMADGIEEKNYEQIQTAQQAALDMIAQGNQVAFSESSTNPVSSEQIDSAASHMYGTYQGQTYSIFDSAAFREKQGLPPITFKDSNAQAQYEFDRETVKSSFANVSSWQVARDFTTALGGDVICQEPIQSTLVFADIGITIGSAFATGGVGAAFKAAASTGVMMGVVSVAMSMAVAGAANDLPEITPNQGILGGDFSFYGAKSAANVTSATAGAAKVSSERASELEKKAARLDIAMAKNQSIASKLSPTNMYSPVAKLANGISPVPAQNARNVASSFANIIMSTIRLPFTLFSSRASAQSASSTDTPQPTAASAQAAASSQNISASDTEQPTLALTAAVENLVRSKDSGDIVSDVASIMRSPGQGYSGSYANRAGTCFGVKFLDTVNSNGETYFDIQYDHLVDNYSPTYTSANCADEKDSKWVAISAAVHIIAVAEAATCRETGDDDACARTGAGATTTTLASDTADTTGAVGEPNTSTGRAQGSWGGYSNGKIPASEPTMTKITSSFLGINAGDTIQICNTKMSKPYLNPSAAVSIKALNDAFKQKYGHTMYFQSCYRDIEGQEYAKSKYGDGAAEVGTSNHGWGLAVDIGPNPKKDQGCDASSSELTSAEKEMCQWITDNAPKYGWKNGKDVVPSEQWHFEYSRSLPTGSGV